MTHERASGGEDMIIFSGTAPRLSFLPGAEGDDLPTGSSNSTLLCGIFVEILSLLYVTLRILKIQILNQ